MNVMAHIFLSGGHIFSFYVKIHIITFFLFIYSFSEFALWWDPVGHIISLLSVPFSFYFD